MDVIYKPTNINFKLNKLIDSKFGAETVQWLERWTRDRKVSGSSLGRSSGTIFFNPGPTLSADSYFGIRTNST